MKAPTAPWYRSTVTPGRRGGGGAPFDAAAPPILLGTGGGASQDPPSVPPPFLSIAWQEPGVPATAAGGADRMAVVFADDRPVPPPPLPDPSAPPPEPLTLIRTEKLTDPAG